MVCGQSILEYLIVLAAIIIAIVFNTIGFRAGVQNSLGLQNNLNTTANTAARGVNQTQPPASVTGEAYYNAPERKESDPALANSNVKPMDIKNFDYTGGYDYETWVRDNPASAYHAPAAGYVYPAQPNAAEAAAVN